MATGHLIQNSQQQSIPPAFDASGVFETCRVEKGRLLSLAEHLLRLKHSLQTVGISLDLEKEVRKRLREAAAGLGTGFVRVAIRRKVPQGESQILIYRQSGIPYTKRQLERGLDLRTSATRWPLADASPAQAKGSERLSSVLSRLEGGSAPETLRIGPSGYLTEGTASNLFLVQGNRLVTPPSWLGVLEGVTREQILWAAKRFA